MGNTGEKICSAFTPSKDFKIFIGGLNGSGKTTILYQLKLGQDVNACPTIGFNVETIVIDQTRLTFWDVGGGSMIKPLFRHYFEGVCALIYVIRDYSPYGIKESKEELWKYHLQYLDVKIPILIFANEPFQGYERDLDKVKQIMAEAAPGRKVHYQICSAQTRAGLYEGLQWLIGIINPRR